MLELKDIIDFKQEKRLLTNEFQKERSTCAISNIHEKDYLLKLQEFFSSHAEKIVLEIYEKIASPRIFFKRKNLKTIFETAEKHFVPMYIELLHSSNLGGVIRTNYISKEIPFFEKTLYENFKKHSARILDKNITNIIKKIFQGISILIPFFGFILKTHVWDFIKKLILQI